MTTATQTQPKPLTSAQAKQQAERILSDWCDQMEAQDAARAARQAAEQTAYIQTTKAA